ncbi:sensor histidine kinase [Filimonas zeae]|nr:ATP-binding protein [Filimonas zeae]
MEMPDKKLLEDIQKIQSLEIIPSILDLVCRSTGMRFAAVARVTEKQWIACVVKDDIEFGLKAGGELQIETTICNDIRSTGEPVVIDHVREDERFKNHHTPRIYGFQSYISMPIILKDGTFFGTLCAIDPLPIPLSDMNAATMFALYADLISFHLYSQEQRAQQNQLLESTRFQLQQSQNNLRQYSHISRHTLQEPLRKLQLFSGMLEQDMNLPPNHKAVTIAGKINILAAEFSTMINDLTDFSDFEQKTDEFQLVDLDTVLKAVLNRLRFKIAAKEALVHRSTLTILPAIPQQISQLFYHVLDNALTFTNPLVPVEINVYGCDVTAEELAAYTHLTDKDNYYKVCIEDNGIGFDRGHSSQIFDLFARLNTKEQYAGIGMGLSQARKIIEHHNGFIIVDSETGKGTRFCLVFPKTLPQ